MYGDGNAEAIVGEAIAGRRDEVYLVSKCYPHHAGAKTMPQACEHSLARLRIDRSTAICCTGADACRSRKRSRRSSVSCSAA